MPCGNHALPRTTCDGPTAGPGAGGTTPRINNATSQHPNTNVRPEERSQAHRERLLFWHHRSSTGRIGPRNFEISDNLIIELRRRVSNSLWNQFLGENSTSKVEPSIVYPIRILHEQTPVRPPTPARDNSPAACLPRTSPRRSGGYYTRIWIQCQGLHSFRKEHNSEQCWGAPSISGNYLVVHA